MSKPISTAIVSAIIKDTYGPYARNILRLYGIEADALTDEQCLEVFRNVSWDNEDDE